MITIHATKCKGCNGEKYVGTRLDNCRTCGGEGFVNMDGSRVSFYVTASAFQGKLYVIDVDGKKVQTKADREAEEHLKAKDRLCR